MRRVGVMGGTFDPIHHGHLVAASEVQAWFDLDEVLFVPTGDPWQKSDRDVTEAEHRYLMTVVATAANPRFNVSRVDIDREGKTYTIDTLRDLKAEMPDAELFFITGADALADLFTWRDADELFATNERAVGAIVDEIEDKLREVGAKPIRREGHKEGRWVLLDYGEIVVHVQHEEERMFYALERLWSDCPAIALTLT